MATPRSLHFDVQVISRGQSKSTVAAASYRAGKKLSTSGPMRSAVAAASYRSGQPLYDERDQRTFDYTRKEDVRHTEIVAPRNAPDWVKNRQTLWNTVEHLEKRKDAQLARDVIAVFPRELNLEQCKTMIRAYIDDNFVSKGMVADYAIHEVKASDGGKNPHAHIMLTMREIDKDGFGKKNRDWNDQKLVTHWRGSWEKYANEHLAKAGYDVTVTLKSYKELGIDKVPGVHMGDEQWNLEKQGEKTRRGNENRGVKHENVTRDVVKVSAEVEESLDQQWDELLHMLNPEPERSAPVQQLESESLTLKDDKADTDIASVSEVHVSASASTPATNGNTPVASGDPLKAEEQSSAKEQHYATVRNYVESEQFESARKETTRTVSMKRYAGRFMDMAKELAGKAYQQFANLMRETVRERDKDRGHDR